MFSLYKVISISDELLVTCAESVIFLAALVEIFFQGALLNLPVVHIVSIRNNY